jgi:hypothetical protein
MVLPYVIQDTFVRKGGYLQSSKTDFLKCCCMSFEESVLNMMIEFLRAGVDRNVNSHVRVL